LLLASCFLFDACKGSSEQNFVNPSSNAAKVEPNEELLQFIKNLGFSESAIKDVGDSYLVGGDMSFPKNTILETNPERHTDPKSLQTRQYGMQNYVGFNRQPNITIRVDDSLNGILGPITDAINAYNGIPNCRLNFNLTTNATADLLINNGFVDVDVCGGARPPANGRIGSLIRIDLNLITNARLDNDQIRRLIIHELGHAVGLRHTNWRLLGEAAAITDDNTMATNIFGTTTDDDAQSVFNGETCGILPADFSPQDILALQELYRETPPVAGTVPIFRYWNRGNGDHFYTPNLNELGDGNNQGYRFEGVAFYAFTTQVPNSVIVHRYWNTGNGDHFYTTNFNELRNGGNGWVKENQNPFFVFNNAINNSVRILRFYDGRDHFYTKNADEFITGRGNYNFERVGWFAF
jgi:hypothetical protein